MNDEAVDAVLLALGNGASRRGALGLLAGALSLGLGAVEAKRHKRRPKHRTRKGKESHHARAAAKPNKVDVCHYDAGTRSWVRISVSQSGWDNGHAKHARDFLRGDCCTDGDCPDGEGCDLGQCATVHEVCPDGCGFTSLADALGEVKDGDVIRLGPGRYRTLPLFCNSRVTIVGAGSGDDEATNTIVDAEQTGSVLFIGSSADVELRDLKITGGRADGGGLLGNSGGGMVVVGQLRLIGVDIADNYATWFGGGIHNLVAGTSITLRDTTVRRNTAGDSGGGISGAARLTLEQGSIVEENHALGIQGPPDPHTFPGDIISGRGGGIFNLGNFLTMQDGSIVRNNDCAIFGGGIFCGGTATLEAGSRVTGNTAGEAGGGISQLPQATIVIAAGAVVQDNAPDNCEPDIGACT